MRDFPVSPEMKGSCEALFEGQRERVTTVLQVGLACNLEAAVSAGCGRRLPACHSQTQQTALHSNRLCCAITVLPHLFPFSVHFALNIVLLLQSDTLEFHTQLVWSPGTSKQL